jgi:hypothetical protein
MSYSPNVYNTTIPAGITGVTGGIYSVTPVAYGYCSGGSSGTGSGLFNCTTTCINSVNGTYTITIAYGSYTNLCPIATPAQGGNTIGVVSIVGNVITINGFATTGNPQVTAFYFVVYGN